jgi:hypothetical protein
MLTLMLYSRFKSLKLISSFVGDEHEMSIDQKYDRKSLFLMLLKFYHHLHPLFEIESSYVIKLMNITTWTFLRWWSTLMNLQRSLLIENC